MKRETGDFFNESDIKNKKVGLMNQTPTQDESSPYSREK